MLGIKNYAKRSINLLIAFGDMCLMRSFYPLLILFTFDLHTFGFLAKVKLKNNSLQRWRGLRKLFLKKIGLEKNLFR